MLARFSRRFESDAPTVRDFAPDFVGEHAKLILAELYAQRKMDRLDWYRPMGRDFFNVWLPDSVVPGGKRLELKEWAHQYGMSLALATYLRDGRTEQPKRDSSPKKGRGWGKRLKKLLLGVVTIGTLVVSVEACSGPTKDTTSSTAPTPVSAPVTAGHRNFLGVGYCADGTWSVPTQLFVDANRFVAKSIDDGVTMNQDGMVVYVTYVGANPYSAQSTPLTIQVPAIAAPPPVPTAQPTPPADPNNVWAHNNAVATVTANNAQAVQQYNAKVSQLTAQVTQTKDQVKPLTDKLRNLPRPSGSEAKSTSVWQCIELQAQRLQQVHGDKMLVIESDFQDNQPQQALSGVSLKGVTVVAIYMNCTSGGECRSTQDAWGSTFRSMHASSIKFYDPATSANLPPLFGGTTSGK